MIPVIKIRPVTPSGFCQKDLGLNCGVGVETGVILAILVSVSF